MARGKKKDGFLWTEAKKIETVTTYLVVGNSPMTSAITGVPRDTIRHWKMSTWWKEIARELQDENTTELSAKLKKIVDKSIEVVADRLENGDNIFDAKSGSIIKVPVKLKDAVHAATTMIDKRQILMDKPTKIIEQRTVEDRLNKLAEEFSKFSQATQIEIEPAQIENATV